MCESYLCPLVCIAEVTLSEGTSTSYQTFRGEVRFNLEKCDHCGKGGERTEPSTELPGKEGRSKITSIAFSVSDPTATNA